jgi:hypothetical protein
MSVPPIPPSPEDEIEFRQRLHAWFSGLQPGTFEKIGEPSADYNCFAWAAGDMTRRWEPFEADDCYWPDGVAVELTLESFIQAYATVGYRSCESARIERQHEKIAIYMKDGVPSHAAKQTPNGRWTSKLGDYELIEHDFLALEGEREHEYGRVVQLMRRKRRTLGTRLAARLLSWLIRNAQGAEGGADMIESTTKLRIRGFNAGFSFW